MEAFIGGVIMAERVVDVESEDDETFLNGSLLLYPLAVSKRYPVQSNLGEYFDGYRCYTVIILRHLMGEPQVVSARARNASPEIDRYMEADLQFPSGATGQIGVPYGDARSYLFQQGVGTLGSITIANPVIPHILYHHLK